MKKIKRIKTKYIAPADCLFCDSPGKYMYKRYYGFFRFMGFVVCEKCLKKTYLSDSKKIHDAVLEAEK